jgi:hypothetical protein
MRIIPILFFTLFGNAVPAQQTFLVYQLQGNVKLKTGKETKAILIGQLLKSNNTIWLDKGARVVLICEGYNSFTISKSGNQNIVAYLDSCKQEDRSVSAAYFKYVWGELTHPHTTPENNRRQYMQNTGAVVRGCPGIKIDPLYDTVNNNSGDARIKWVTSMKSDQLSFVLFDSEKNGRLLYSSAVTQSYVHLDTLKKYKQGNREVYWNLTINGNEMCSRKFIKFWQSADYTSFMNNLNNSLKTILGMAERYYAIGFELEANHFIAEALAYYKKAALLKPEELRYQQPLDEF